MFSALLKRTFASKLMRGDMVEVISGSLKGSRAKIIINRKKLNWVALENIRVKRKTATGKKVSAYKQIPVSKVALIDPVTDKKTRVHFKKEGDVFIRYSVDNNPIPYPPTDQYRYSAITKKVGIFLYYRPNLNQKQ